MTGLIIHPLQFQKKRPMNPWDQGFVAGIGYAVAVLRRLYHEGASEQLLGESGLSMKDFRKAKVDPYDMVMIRKSAKARGIT